MSESNVTTVDKGEIQRHSELTDWWNPQGSTKCLHSLNYTRTDFILKSLATAAEIKKSSTPLANKKILDVGCGGGLLSESLAKLGAQVTGVDASNVLIDMAKEHCTYDPKVAANKPTYHYTTIEEHSLKFRDYYDVIIASEVIDHVVNVEIFLHACIDALKPGGKLFITAPNRSPLSYFFVIYLAENVLGLIPRGIHHVENFVRPAEVSAMLQKKKCQVDNVHGLFYIPCLNKWIWSYFQSIWYALVATKLDIIKED